MKVRMKKLLSVALTIVMLLSLGMPAMAVEESNVEQQCEEGCTLIGTEHTECVVAKQCEEGCTLTGTEHTECAVAKQCEEGCTLTGTEHTECVVAKQCEEGCTLTGTEHTECVVEKQCEEGCTLTGTEHTECVVAKQCEEGCTLTGTEHTECAVAKQCEEGCTLTGTEHTECVVAKQCEEGCALTGTEHTECVVEKQCEEGCTLTGTEHTECAVAKQCEEGCTLTGTEHTECAVAKQCEEGCVLEGTHEVCMTAVEKALADIQTHIDALPAVEELEGKTLEELKAINDKVTAITLELDKLTDEQKATLDLTKIQAVTGELAQMIQTLENAVAQIGETPYETLDEAVAAAQNGDTITLMADIEYTGTATLVIDKAIVLDLNGKTLTTNGTYGGVQLKNNCTLKNGTLVHKGTVTAIKAWNVAAIEDLVIDVNFKAEGKTIGGIVIQENAAGIGSIKNVTIKGEGLTNGIETYNCGNAASPVIGSMENVTIDAKGTGMLISARVGTATNCSISGGVSGIEIYIKGTYSASLNLVGCTVTGGEQAVYAHDEFSSNPNIVNNGTITLTADAATTFASNSGVLLNEVITRIEANQISLPAALTANAVAEVGGNYYDELAAAVAAANAVEGGATVTLLKDVTLGEKLTISGNVTISGEYTITRDDAYTGTLFAVDAGATLTLDGGLTIDGGNNYAFDSATYKADLAADVTITNNAKYFTPEEGAPVATAHMITTSGTVNLNKVTIKNHYANGEKVLVSAGTGATVNLTGATITHNAITSGSGLVVNASGGKWDTTPVIWVNMNAGTVIDGNHVGGNHGVFKIYMGTMFNMNGGSIKNTTGWNANGVAVGVYWATFNMNGGEICSNSSVGGPNNGRNAAIYVHNSSVFTMNGGTVCHNTGAYGGVDAPKSNSTTTINGGSIVNNNSYINSKYTDIYAIDTTTITGGVFTQDVTQWLAPDLGLTEDESGNYTVTDELYEYNGTAYKTLADAIAAIENDAAPVVKVLASHKAGATTEIGIDLTLDLNGKNILGTTGVNPIIRVTNNANVTVTGNGMIDSANQGDGYCFILGASDGSSAGNLTIKNGTFKGTTSAISVTKGKLTIEDGDFRVKPYNDSYDYLLNCIDANYKDGSAVIEVKGGVFTEFNPANNAAEGEGTDFVAEGYLSEETEEGSGIWTVKKKEITVTIDNKVMAEGGVYPEFTYTVSPDVVPADGLEVTFEQVVVDGIGDYEIKAAAVITAEGWRDYTVNVIPGTLTVQEGVAEANGNNYLSIMDAVNSVAKDEAVTVKVLKDHTVTTENSVTRLITIAYRDVVLDLNGKTVTFDYTTKNNPDPVYTSIYVYGADLTITGNGTLYNKGTNGCARIAWVASASSLVIENGTYINEQPDTMFYTSNSNKDVPTTLYVRDGTFRQMSMAEGQNDFDCFNQQDNYQKQIIELTGGNYNEHPKNGRQNDWEVTIPETHQVKQIDENTWSVVLADDIEAVIYGETFEGNIYGTLAEVAEQANDGDTIVLQSDVADSAAVIDADNVSIDRNGKKITDSSITVKDDASLNLDGLTIVGAEITYDESGNRTIKTNEKGSITDGKFTINGTAVVTGDVINAGAGASVTLGGTTVDLPAGAEVTVKEDGTMVINPITDANDKDKATIEGLGTAYLPAMGTVTLKADGTYTIDPVQVYIDVNNNGKKDPADINIDRDDNGKPDLNVDKNGNYKMDDADDNVDTDADMLPEYRFIKGMNGVWYYGNTWDLSFTVNGLFEDVKYGFRYIEVDDVKVDVKNYTAVSGSTIIVLDDEYLQTLSSGKHKLTAVYADGEAETVFYVCEPGTNPQTGDNSQIGLYAVLFGASLIALTGAALILRKRKSEQE